MTIPKQKRRPLGKGTGALECLQLGGSGQVDSYPKQPPSAMWRLRSIWNDDGHFQGWEVMHGGR